MPNCNTSSMRVIILENDFVSNQRQTQIVVIDSIMATIFN